jgi:NADPH-dependent 7-cyano-7-deazaguanine reductase QueF
LRFCASYIAASIFRATPTKFVMLWGRYQKGGDLQIRLFMFSEALTNTRLGAMHWHFV